MHGVGKDWAALAFQSFGIPSYIPVPQQIEPHPDFPTVPFPNPEEGKGALVLNFIIIIANWFFKKLSMDTADAHNSRLIIANDPDADRLAVAEKIAK